MTIWFLWLVSLCQHWLDLFIVDTKYYAGEVCLSSRMFKFVVKLRFTRVKILFSVTWIYHL